MVLEWIGGELWRGQTQNGVILAFQVKLDLDGQGQSPPPPPPPPPPKKKKKKKKKKGDLNQVVLHLLLKVGGFSMNARTSSGLTDTHTDQHRPTQPRVKMI